LCAVSYDVSWCSLMYLAAHLPPVLPAQTKHQRHIIVELSLVARLVARLAQPVQLPLVTTRSFSALGRERGWASGFCLLGRIAERAELVLFFAPMLDVVL
jgi:hypothetical protein